jgi:hypothetical protein
MVTDHTAVTVLARKSGVATMNLGLLQYKRKMRKVGELPLVGATATTFVIKLFRGRRGWNHYCLK